VSTITFFLKSSIALLRTLRKKDDGWNAFAGAFVGGYLAMFLIQSKKIFLATYLLSRSLETIYNSIADRGYFKKNSNHWVAIYMLTFTVIGYSYAHEQYLSDPGMMSFI